MTAIMTMAKTVARPMIASLVHAVATRREISWFPTVVFMVNRYTIDGPKPQSLSEQLFRILLLNLDACAASTSWKLDPFYAHYSPTGNSYKLLHLEPASIVATRLRPATRLYCHFEHRQAANDI